MQFIFKTMLIVLFWWLHLASGHRCVLTLVNVILPLNNIVLILCIYTHICSVACFLLHLYISLSIQNASTSTPPLVSLCSMQFPRLWGTWISAAICIHRIASGGYYGFDFVTPTPPPQCVERFHCYRSNEKNIHSHKILPGNIFGLILKNKMAATGVFRL